MGIRIQKHSLNKKKYLSRIVSDKDSKRNLLYHKEIQIDISNCFIRYKVKKMDKNQLFIELKGIQRRGITIFLEGEKSTPEVVSDLLCIQEDSSYMRDYVYDEGVLTELHFDKVHNE